MPRDIFYSIVFLCAVFISNHAFASSYWLEHYEKSFALSTKAGQLANPQYPVIGNSSNTFISDNTQILPIANNANVVFETDMNTVLLSNTNALIPMNGLAVNLYQGYTEGSFNFTISKSDSTTHNTASIDMLFYDIATDTYKTIGMQYLGSLFKLSGNAGIAGGTILWNQNNVQLIINNKHYTYTLPYGKARVPTPMIPVILFQPMPTGKYLNITQAALNANAMLIPGINACAQVMANPSTFNFYAGSGYSGYTQYTTVTKSTCNPVYYNYRQGMIKKFADNFVDATELNLNNWVPGYDYFYGGNGELERYYPTQVEVIKGTGLVLSAAIALNANGFPANNSNAAYKLADGTKIYPVGIIAQNDWHKPFISGKIYARYKDDKSGNGLANPNMAISQGCFEFSAKVPKGLGFWPAGWMLKAGYNSAAGDDSSWPLSGEIDVLEITGGYTNALHGTLHTATHPDYIGNTCTGGDRAIGGVYLSPTDLSQGFHVYAACWNTSQFSFYIDGALYKNINMAASIPTNPSTCGNNNIVMDKANMLEIFGQNNSFAPIFNLAMGGAIDGTIAYQTAPDYGFDQINASATKAYGSLAKMLEEQKFIVQWINIWKPAK